MNPAIGRRALWSRQALWSGPARWATVAALTAVAMLAGCAALPPFPSVPTVAPALIAASDLVPSGPAPTASSTPATSGPVSPDGFSAAQRIAVRIRNIGCGELSTGTGFAIDDHTIVTNRHVVSGLATLQVLTYDGRDISVTGAATAAIADLAIVHTSDTLPLTAQLADADPAIGQHITIVGFPEGGRLTLTEGTILKMQDDPLHSSLAQVLVSDAPVQPGSSGSAVLDDAGQVVGVVYAKSGDNRSYIVPITALRSMLDDPTQFASVTPCA